MKPMPAKSEKRIGHATVFISRHVGEPLGARGLDAAHSARGQVMAAMQDLVGRYVGRYSAGDSESNCRSRIAHCSACSSARGVNAADSARGQRMAAAAVSSS